MAWLSPLAEKRAASTGEAYQLKDPALAGLFGAGSSSASGQQVSTDSALRVSTVYACISVRSQMIGMLPTYIKRLREDGGKEVLSTHRYSSILNFKANRWQNAYEWFALMQTLCDLRGNGYSEIVYNPGRMQNELVPMHPDRVYPFVVTPSGVTYYMYGNSPCPPPGSKLYYRYYPLNSESRVLLDSEVFHIRGFSLNGIIGLDPITKLAREAIGLSLATEETGASFFANGAQIAKVYTNPNKLSDVTYDRMKQQLREQFTGSSKAGGTMILEEGTKIENLSMTMEAAQFIETRKFQVEELARIYNVPLVLIGHGDKAPTYASASEFFSSFKTHTMQPIVTNWEQTLKNSLLTFAEDRDCIVDMDMDSLMRADAKSRAEYFSKRFASGSMTPNDIRKTEGDNPSDQEGMDKFYIMSNIVPLDKAGEQIKPAKPEDNKEPAPQPAAGGQE